jgi:broad specificity phosphatase PhoE
MPGDHDLPPDQTLYLVRHAETEANRGGVGDELTARGHAQIAALAADLPAVDAVYASDLPRARITAEGLGRAVIVEPRLAEILAILVGGETRDPPPGRAEADRLRAEALLPWVSGLPERRIALVTHANVIRYLLARALGLPGDRMYGLAVDSCSITTIERRGASYLLRRLNDTRGIPLPEHPLP